MLVELPGALRRISRTTLLTQAAAAQEEDCQLLQVALQQAQQQGQPAAQQHPHMWRTSQQLLSTWAMLDSWCARSHGLEAQRPAQALALQKRALELAAVMAQTLTADSHETEFLRIFIAVERYGLKIVRSVTGFNSQLPLHPISAHNASSSRRLLCTALMASCGAWHPVYGNDSDGIPDSAGCCMSHTLPLDTCRAASLRVELHLTSTHAACPVSMGQDM
jgi:hypothetical protein